MNKTLMLATSVLMLVGVATTASADPTNFRCATPTPELGYVVATCNYVGSGDARQDVVGTVAFVAGEAVEIATHPYVDFPGDGHRCATTSPEARPIVEACNYVLGGGAYRDATGAAAFGAGEANEAIATLLATYGPRLP